MYGPDDERWDYKRLDVDGGQLIEDGEQLPNRTLKLRSIELINDGWEPFEASESHRRYRRTAPPAVK